MTLVINDTEKLYKKGIEYYENLQYDEAIIIFKALAAKSPGEKKFWQLLAHSLQAKKEYELALKAWAMTTLLSEDDPFPPYFAAECYFHLNNSKEALKALKDAQEKNRNKDPSLTEKIHALKLSGNLI